jgi:hypothetical protein
LTLSDFPDLTVSADMTQHLRRHILTVKNPNTVVLTDFIMRFQLPEPVLGGLLVENRPAGVEISWHACRTSFALMGNGASAAPAGNGAIRMSTGAAPGSSATLFGQGEVCSSAMDNEKLHRTGIYQLQIERLPAIAEIRLAFLTSNGPEDRLYSEISGEDGVSDNAGLPYYGDGRYQYSSGGHTETRDVFVPLQFDRKLRSISSSPSSGEHGKWRIRRMTTN